MPLYPYRCDHCGLEFEVSRPISRAAEPANCPLDSAPGVRIFTAPVRLTTRGQDAPPAPPKSAADAASAAGSSHFGHSHGGGDGGHGHSHGPPNPQPPPAG